MEKDLPLSGVRVIDMSTYAAVPSCGRLLADWGADVIKVESLSGEPFRSFGLVMGIPADEDENPIYEVDNANKRGIAIDLKSAKGQEIIHKLLADADVFITNLRIRALRKLGLSYESLAQKYPKLIYGFLSGFGEKGPDAGKPGFDLIAYWVRSGATIDLVDPSGYPMNPPIAFGDHPSGTALAAGICAALVRQRRTGKGDKVSISLFGNAIWNSGLMITSAGSYNEEYPKTRAKPTGPLVVSYKCKDGEWIMLSILEHDRYWASFCASIGRDDLADDDRFKTISAAKEHSAVLVPILEEVIATRTRGEWIDIWTKADFAFFKLQHFKDVVRDEQALANDYIYKHVFANGNEALLPRTPILFETMRLASHRRAPLVGEDAEEILAELGYTSKEIAEMEANEILRMSRGGQKAD